MTTVNVFKDKDGDYIVTSASAITAGTKCIQLSGEVADAEGGPIQSLSIEPMLVLLMNLGTLKDGDRGTVADLVKRYQPELVESVDLSDDHKIVLALSLS